jgi:sugar phosphate isomerase/epimerase
VADDPEGRQLSRTIDGCELLMEGLADLGVGMTLDPCNFVVTGQDPWEAFERLRSHVRNLHVKDAVRAGGPADPGAVVWHDSIGGAFNGVPSGTGDSRLGEILSAAVRDDPGLTITIEHAVADVLGQFAAGRYAAEVEWVRRVAATA